MPTPGWAVIGASRVASRRMIPAIRRHADGQILAIHSHNAARARTFADVHYIPHAFTDLDQMLSRFDIGFVYVGSHPRHHAEGVIAGLRAGKHVLCESPLALNHEEATRLVMMAANRGLTLALNHQFRANPAVQTMRHLLQEERIGQIITVRVSNAHMLPAERQSWRLLTPGGGVLLDRTIHDIDLVRYLLDDEPLEAAGALGQSILGDTAEGMGGHSAAEEEVFIHLRMRRGDVHVHIHDSFLLPHAINTFEVHGTRGALIAQRWTERERAGGLFLMCSGQSEIIEAQSTSASTNPYDDVVRAFHTAATNPPGQQGDASAEILAPGADGLKNLAIILKLADILRRSRYTRLERPPVHSQT